MTAAKPIGIIYKHDADDSPGVYPGWWVMPPMPDPDDPDEWVPDLDEDPLSGPWTSEWAAQHWLSTRPTRTPGSPVMDPSGQPRTAQLPRISPGLRDRVDAERARVGDRSRAATVSRLLRLGLDVAAGQWEIDDGGQS